MLEVGDPAPDFTRGSTQGKVTLSEVNGRAVLFFFPKAGTHVCTKESCLFRDSLSQFNTLDATVIGISHNDTLEELREFAAEHRLDYPLVSDNDGELGELYDVSGPMGLYRKRVTYVVGGGVILGKVDSMFRASKHVEEPLEILRASD